MEPHYGLQGEIMRMNSKHKRNMCVERKLDTLLRFDCIHAFCVSEVKKISRYTKLLRVLAGVVFISAAVGITSSQRAQAVIHPPTLQALKQYRDTDRPRRAPKAKKQKALHDKPPQLICVDSEPGDPTPTTLSSGITLYSYTGARCTAYIIQPTPDSNNTKKGGSK